MDYPKNYNTIISDFNEENTIFRASCSNKEEAEAWIKEFSFITNTNWIVCYDLKEPDRLVLHRKYKCHHSAKNKSSKLLKNTYCDAKLDFKIKKNNKSTRRNDTYLKLNKSSLVALICISNKHNHITSSAASMKFLKPSENTIDIFNDYFDDGLSAAQAKRQHVNSLLIEKKIHLLADSSINPTKNAIYYLYHKWKVDHFGQDINPLTKFREKLDYYRNLGSDVVFDEKESLWAVVIVTPIMKRNHDSPLSSEMAFIDSTASCDTTQTNVTVVLTASKAGAIPLAIILHNSASTEGYKQAFGLLSSAFPLCFGCKKMPEIIMTDDSSAERAALKFTFPSSTLLLCQFHVLQAEWRWLLTNSTTDFRQELMLSFKKTVYAGSRLLFDEAVEQLLHHQTDHPEFCNRFMKYLPRQAEWALFARIHLITRNHNTNNFSEASIRVLKDIILTRTKAFNPIALADFIVKIWDKYFLNRLLDIAYGRNNEIVNNYNVLCSKLPELLAENVTKLCINVYKIPTKNEEGYYIINTDLGYCTCRSGQHGGFCKHQAWLHKNLNIQLPNSPPVTLQDKYELATLALGSECPPLGFFLELRDNSNMNNNTIEMQANIPNNSELDQEIRIDEAVDHTEFIELNELGASFQIEDCVNEFRRMLDLVSQNTNGSKHISRIFQKLSSINNVNKATLASISFANQITQINRRGGKIKTQPTAAARRRHGLSRGSAPAPMGRPKLKTTKRHRKKKKVPTATLR